ncbi:MAG: TonB-dependent receptor [Draconibacterium sp.]|nr:MAG: TonB-dependent receptor [Draconibacterium sp.]
MKKTMTTALIAVFSLFSLNTFAQMIKGTVVDAESNETLIGAAVVLQGTSNGTSTDLDGTFAFKVPAGEHNIVVSYIGYISLTKKINVRSGQTLDLGEIKLESNVVGLEEVLITASFAKDRQTPVSMSTINPVLIEEKLGSQEFPEILKTTPSIYATKDNGGYGDSRITLRGFDTYNVGVLINGIPVNGMEDAKVYWSNWASLSDVTQNIQVQRGLGASKLGLSSVGGTINIITRSTDAGRGGSVYSGIGNDGYRKQAFAVSSGLMDNGWAVTLFGVHTYGDGYMNGTQFDAYNYFANVSKQFNDQHMLSLTIFGAPQTHNQRGNRHTIEWYRNQREGIKASSNYGIYQGKQFGGAYGYNYYHKPQAALNYYWNINNNTFWSNVLYASVGRGGGRRVSGPQSSWLGVNYSTGEDYPDIKRTPSGLLDFDAVSAENINSLEGSQAIIAASVNHHNWYGLLSTLTTKWLGLDWTAGFDGRYYYGKHFYEVKDLLGGKFFVDNSDINKPENVKLMVGDHFNYSSDGEVIWAGLFLQSEYKSDKFSGFFSAALSDKSYRRIDFFKYTPGNQKTEWVNFLPWNVKGGINYNVTERQNFYANAGYIKREPIFNNAFLNYTNEINKDAKFETVITAEVGYGFQAKRFRAKMNYYWTNWLDKALVRSLGQGGTANIPGINALHQGFEAEVTYKPTSKITLKGMLSLGDWVWQDDVNYTQYDEAQNVIGTYKAYIKGVHVGNSAQSTAALSANIEILPGLRLGADYLYLAKNFADFNVVNRVKPEDAVDAWQMPNVGLVDMNIKYDFDIAGLDASIYANVNNLLNTEYVADATDGFNHDRYTSLVYFGFGSTWLTGLRIKF